MVATIHPLTAGQQRQVHQRLSQERAFTQDQKRLLNDIGAQRHHAGRAKALQRAFGPDNKLLLEWLRLNHLVVLRAAVRTWFSSEGAVVARNYDSRMVANLAELFRFEARDLPLVHDQAAFRRALYRRVTSAPPDDVEIASAVIHPASVAPAASSDVRFSVNVPQPTEEQWRLTREVETKNRVLGERITELLAADQDRAELSASTIADLKQAVAAHADDLAELKVQYDRQLTLAELNLRAQHALELQDIRHRDDDERATLRSSHARELHALQEQLMRETVINGGLRAEIATLNRQRDEAQRLIDAAVVDGRRVHVGAGSGAGIRSLIEFIHQNRDSLAGLPLEKRRSYASQLMVLVDQHLSDVLHMHPDAAHESIPDPRCVPSWVRPRTVHMELDGEDGPFPVFWQVDHEAPDINERHVVQLPVDEGGKTDEPEWVGRPSGSGLLGEIKNHSLALRKAAEYKALAAPKPDALGSLRSKVLARRGLIHESVESMDSMDFSDDDDVEQLQVAPDRDEYVVTHHDSDAESDEQ